MFSCEFCEISKNTVFTEHLWTTASTHLTWSLSTDKNFRSSRQEVFCQKCVLRSFTEFTGKHLCQRLWYRCFLVKFVKFLRTPFYIEHLWWLLWEFVSWFSETFSALRNSWLRTCKSYSTTKGFAKLHNTYGWVFLPYFIRSVSVHFLF